jgi:hypothetical protein
VLRAPRGLEQARVKTGLAFHQRTPESEVEIGEAIHLGTLTEDVSGLRVIKPRLAKLIVEVTLPLPDALAKQGFPPERYVDLAAWHVREGFREHDPQLQKLWLAGARQTNNTRYEGTALPGEEILFQISTHAQGGGDRQVLIQQKLTLEPGEERRLKLDLSDVP